MWNDTIEVRWQEEVVAVLVGMKEWRLQHPRASLREIEGALDERWARMRARMLQDMALASAAARLSEAAESERPTCPGCGGPLESRGEHERTLMTSYDQPIRLERSYATCPACGTGLFPPGRGIETGRG